MKLTSKDFEIQRLGKPSILSPLDLSMIDGDLLTNYIPEEERILYNNSLSDVKNEFKSGKNILSFEQAGPREKIFFDPSKCKAGIVTCGGLCPGINDVIRGIVMQLTYWYKIKTIYGFRYGFTGLIKENGFQPIVLDPEGVADIHEQGGSILSSSRGPQDIEKMVDRLMEFGINILFCIGGDGTLRGAGELTDEITKRGLPISIIGVPKTIDNDIGFIEKTFGFETAFTYAVEAIRAGHTEAKGYQNGIGLIKLMGRESGYITANASIASQSVNFCLIPEIPFDLQGENGLYAHLEKRLERKPHAVIVVAEGVADNLCPSDEKDISGNKKLIDVGLFLRDDIKRHFASKNIPVSLKYIDPSYMIRSHKAIASDSIYCNQLAQYAAHAGMSGRTGMVVGDWHNRFIHIPIQMAVKNRKFIEQESLFWLNVLETTGMPKWMKNDARPTGKLSKKNK